MVPNKNKVIILLQFFLHITECKNKELINVFGNIYYKYIFCINVIGNYNLN